MLEAYRLLGHSAGRMADCYGSIILELAVVFAGGSLLVGVEYEGNRI
jgi:hypothetical protein